VEGWYALPCHEEIEPEHDPGKREIQERLKDKNTVQYHHPTWANRYLVTPRHYIREHVTKRTLEAVVFSREIDTPRGTLTATVERRYGSYGNIWTTEYPVKTREDIEKMRSIPWELPEGLAPIDVSRLPADPYGQRVVYAYISTPAICVAGMMDVQDFFIMCATDFDLIRELTELCEQRLMTILDVILARPGIDVVWIGGSEWLTPPMASPDMYDELIHEQEKRLIERIHQGGALAHVHCHGNVRGILPQLLEREADYFEPVEPPPEGDILFRDAKEQSGAAMTLGGNIEISTIERETEKEVEAAVYAALEGRKERMVLATSAGSTLTHCSPQIVKNYHRIIDIWKKESVLDQ
jgi:hypothetical protein